MDEFKGHKLDITSNGRRVTVKLDGEELKYITNLRLEIDAKTLLPKVQLTLLSRDINISLDNARVSACQLDLPLGYDSEGNYYNPDTYPDEVD